MKKLKYYGEGDRLYVQSQRIWQILVGVVGLKRNYSGMGKGIITYGDLCLLMNKPLGAARTLDRQLGIIATFCQEHGLPALNVVVVNKKTGQPGSSVMWSETENPKKERKAVLSCDWFEIRPPSVNQFKSVYDISRAE